MVILPCQPSTKHRLKLENSHKGSARRRTDLVLQNTGLTQECSPQGISGKKSSQRSRMQILRWQVEMVKLCQLM